MIHHHKVSKSNLSSDSVSWVIKRFLLITFVYYILKSGFVSSCGQIPCFNEGFSRTRLDRAYVLAETKLYTIVSKPIAKLCWILLPWLISAAEQRLLITWEWETIFPCEDPYWYYLFLPRRDINIALIYSHGVGIGWKRRRSSQWSGTKGHTSSVSSAWE